MTPVIAIIGGGFSGSMVAVHLLKNATCPLNIQLIERRPTIGQGVAYSTLFDCHLLNVEASKMSAFPDEPDHFLNWLKHYNEQYRQRTDTFNAKSFVPRKLYGKYIQTILEEAIATASDRVSLEQITDEVVDIKKDSTRTKVFLVSGKVVEADSIVLALGNFSSTNPPVADPSFYQSKRYIASVWSALPLSSINPNDSVLLIGSGLTAIDAILALYQRGHRGKFHVVSRHGLFPNSHHRCSSLPLPPSLTSAQAPKNVRALFSLVRQEVESATARGYSWQAVIDSLRGETQALWQALPLAEKCRFLRHLRPLWEVHRHRIAPEVARIMTQLQETEQLVLHAGRIQAYREDANGVDVVVRQRGSHKSFVLRAESVINCTGPQCNYQKIQHPLIINLLASGLIRPDALKLGLDVDSNGAAIDAEGNVQNWLYTLGTPRKGQLWETTAVREIRSQAKTLADRLLTKQFAIRNSQFAIRN